MFREAEVFTLSGLSVHFDRNTHAQFHVTQASVTSLSPLHLPTQKMSNAFALLANNLASGKGETLMH